MKWWLPKLMKPQNPLPKQSTRQFASNIQPTILNMPVKATRINSKEIQFVFQIKANIYTITRAISGVVILNEIYLMQQLSRASQQYSQWIIFIIILEKNFFFSVLWLNMLYRVACILNIFKIVIGEARTYFYKSTRSYL